MASSYLKTRSVFVRAYNRIRFGRTEHVRQHYRSPPHQLALAF